MILHIPHSSTILPDTFQISEGISLKKEFQRMTDWYTDELFDFLGATKLVFPYSRLYCDVERFRDDNEEEMAKKGMGVCYTTNSFGGRLREVSDAEKEEIKSIHYDDHHRQFADLVTAELEENGTALIVDCHSFSNEVLPHEESRARPDICIGTDTFHTSPELLQEVSRYFEEQGCEVAVDQPFAGTIVPLKYYGKDQRVSSIMIEVNRKLYLDENFEKNEQFKDIQMLIAGVLKRIH
jgi:N-formylglutamate amidohydrolase